MIPIRFKRSRSTPTQSSQLSTTTRSSAKGKSQRSVVAYKKKYDIPRWGFPRRLYIAHKYVDLVSVSSTAGVVGSYFFKCNGMFDPNTTGTGHQPMYFDNCGAIYNHYTVVKLSLIHI